MSFLTVDRMAVVVKTPTSKEVVLPSISPKFLYHQSLWAEIRTAPGGESFRVYPKNGGTDPEKAPLTEFERVYWDMCGWNVRSRFESPDEYSLTLV